jgi:hypothetical protein
MMRGNARRTNHAGRWIDQPMKSHQAYAAEELVAEIAAAFLCAEPGITQETRADHAQYLAQWLQLLKDDSQAFSRPLRRPPGRQRGRNIQGADAAHAASSTEAAIRFRWMQPPTALRVAHLNLYNIVLYEVRQFAHDHVPQRLQFAPRASCGVLKNQSHLFLRLEVADIAASCGRQERFGWLCTGTAET